MRHSRGPTVDVRYFCDSVYPWRKTTEKCQVKIGKMLFILASGIARMVLTVFWEWLLQLIVVNIKNAFDCGENTR